MHNSYKEKGLGQYNASVGSTSHTSPIGIIGIKAMTSAANVSENMSITPEFHVFIDNNFNGKVKNPSVRVNGSSANLKSDGASSKRSPLEVNLGTSVMAMVRNLEFGVTYNYNFRQKYESHQGSLKFKISL